MNLYKIRLVWVIYICDLFREVIAACYVPLISQHGLVVALTVICAFLIGLWSITLLLENLLVVFLFLEGTWSDTFNFYFAGFSDVVPNVLLEEQACLLHLQFLEDLRHDLLSHPLCYLSSITLSFSVSVFCCWRLPLSSLGVSRHAWLACLWNPLLFDVSYCMALLWFNCFTFSFLNGCVERTSYQTTTFFSLAVRCSWSCRCLV